MLHAGLVAALTAFLLVTEWLQPDDVADANIGGGIAFLGLSLVGLPWSAPEWFVDGWERRIAIVVAAAALNVVIHARFWAWMRRRRVRAGLER